jgi:hypothetical protein
MALLLRRTAAIRAAVVGPQVAALSFPASWHGTTPGQTRENSRAADVFVSAPQPTSDVFYMPTTLTARQRQVYESVSVSKAGLADHGYLYGLTEADLAGRSELVRRALSTRTGSTQDQLRFRRAEIVRKFGTTPADTGASRVQVSASLAASLCCCCCLHPALRPVFSRLPFSPSASTACRRISERIDTISTRSARLACSQCSGASC